MSDDDAKVDWSLLPQAPIEFFRLNDAFDRKELKRAYNRLLRQFKPEKRPQEFQRIRAAYELLDNQLRYGAAATPTLEYRWQTDDAVPLNQDGSRPREPSRSTAFESSRSPAQDAPKPSTPPLHVRIRQEPLANVYRQLSEKQHKLPYDFYALAVMSDVVHRKDGQQFLRWLLQGLNEHRQDQALLSLLYEYLRGPTPIEFAARLLVAISKTVRTDEFFPLTENVWHRLLRERPFAEFRKTFEVCKSNLRDVGIDSRLAFTVEILKAAIWVADADWINRAFALIEENFERVAFQLQNDLDLLDFLRRYISGRPALATAGQLRRQIDEALREFFAGEQASRDRSVLQCQVRIAEDPDATLAAFPLESDEDYSNFYILWSYVTSDVAERHVTERAPANVSAWMSRGRALFENIERRVTASRLYAKWTFVNILHLLGIAICCFLCFTILASILSAIAISIKDFLNVSPRNDGYDILTVTASCVFGVLFAAWVGKRYIGPRRSRFQQSQATRCYEAISRSELAAFLQRSQFSHPELRELLFNSDISNLTMAQSTADHFQKDYALAIYAMALHFQV